MAYTLTSETSLACRKRPISEFEREHALARLVMVCELTKPLARGAAAAHRHQSTHISNAPPSHIFTPCLTLLQAPFRRSAVLDSRIACHHRLELPCTQRIAKSGPHADPHIAERAAYYYTYSLFHTSLHRSFTLEPTLALFLSPFLHKPSDIAIPPLLQRCAAVAPVDTIQLLFSNLNIGLSCLCRRAVCRRQRQLFYYFNSFSRIFYSLSFIVYLSLSHCSSYKQPSSGLVRG